MLDEKGMANCILRTMYVIIALFLVEETVKHASRMKTELTLGGSLKEKILYRRSMWRLLSIVLCSRIVFPGLLESIHPFGDEYGQLAFPYAGPAVRFSQKKNITDVKRTSEWIFKKQVAETILLLS